MKKLSCINDNISPEMATKRIRQVFEYAMYKSWDCEIGDDRAQEIMENFRNGLYGSNDGIWVQIKEAIEFMENLYLDK